MREGGGEGVLQSAGQLLFAFAPCIKRCQCIGPAQLTAGRVLGMPRGVSACAL